MKQLIDQWWALREDKSHKIRYDLIPLNQLKRLAIHYSNGAKVHWDRNWESGNMEYAEKCKESAWRHFVQWQMGESDEDHAMAIVWNVFAYEFLKDKNMQIDMEKLMEAFINY